MREQRATTPNGGGRLRAAAKRFDMHVNSRGRDQLVEMLRREFRAMARVHHANLVQILGVVIDDPSYSCARGVRTQPGARAAAAPRADACSARACSGRAFERRPLR